MAPAVLDALPPMTHLPVSGHPVSRMIASSSNSLLKVFRRALKDGVTREGWLAVEGATLVEEALRSADASLAATVLRSRCSIRCVLLAERHAWSFASLLARLSPEVEVAQASDRAFQSVAQTVTPQGIAALVEIQRPDLIALLRAANVLLVLACGVQDPGNLGTILRSSEAFGAHGVLALKSTVNALNPKVVRASAGSIFRLPIYSGLDGDSVFHQLRQARIRMVAADPRSQASIADCNLRGSIAILIGNEAAGLNKEWAHWADERAMIPLELPVESLNAAVSAAIFLYEAARQRRHD
jgi:RNA methyltransferase, TrmH family